ncbi:hypothetical protein GLOIN_2v1483933 [Rhizophagus irregularis DAOM 181602=DAOM 197198]|nr:hypothetical protein GLOIN_2v1483933 [Rhizophagus irregularis DAOM 181602=DAOM 197198]POG64433.1 hypothetical protein GLOIN_2v1483933 [Rhizophagus irregularis DAOM 181602=DAOM 197198]|eukprot:XP_025171299.1 hypothetical protein GLOIN_2v1483933 [Rhizophagus irregularis DAOM 181602=DAOM 197198]
MIRYHIAILSILVYTKKIVTVKVRCVIYSGKKIIFSFRTKIIGLAEQNQIMMEYTTLNNDFKQRLKNENRYQDKKEVGDKKPNFESSTSRSWSAEELENDQDKWQDWIKKAQEKGLVSPSKPTNNNDRKEKKKKK